MSYREAAEEILRIIWPFIQEIVNEALHGAGNYEEAITEAYAELICLKVEMTVRRMVRELNEKARGGDSRR